MEKLDNGLSEHEFDHVFFGVCDDHPDINTAEVLEWKAIPYKALQEELLLHPAGFTPWFRLMYEKVNACISEIK